MLREHDTFEIRPMDRVPVKDRHTRLILEYYMKLWEVVLEVVMISDTLGGFVLFASCAELPT